MGDGAGPFSRAFKFARETFGGLSITGFALGISRAFDLAGEIFCEIVPDCALGFVLDFALELTLELTLEFCKV